MVAKRFEGSYSGHKTQEECFDAGCDPRLFIGFTPILAVFRLRKVIDELAPDLTGVAVLNLVSLHMPSHPGRSGYDR